MNDQNKNIHKQQEAPKSTQGAAAVKPSSWKRLLAKKWVFPATYMAAAAIILTLMWVYQDSGSKNLSDKDLGLKTVNKDSKSDHGKKPDDALAVTAPPETMKWPVENRNDLQVIMPFFDSAATSEQKQAATIQYKDTFIPNMGVSLAKEDNSAFDILAAMSGKVTRVDKVPLIGNLVEITHENGLKTVYQSLNDVAVSLNQEVKQGDVIAKAGRNELEKTLGVHLHFEIRQNDQPVNPETFIAKK